MAIAAMAAALLPLSPAHAAYGADQPVYLQLTSNDGNATQLALLDGTVAFDDGNTKYRYSLRLCWQHAYPAPYFMINVNGTRACTELRSCCCVFSFVGAVEAGRSLCRGAW
ncbi:hypothetical protein GCM10027612_60960 [Microbispora bryophytorum subsp. camponoti]|uniref:Uncharacterized protein n=2 Tax=Microbispora bryophytorum TaxID=1460882 RepID=A0ABR8LAG2_9ACTN|nr:hypothetical protein [Microbispora camponoti]MBD3147236.1 hypothetical protein [Microbispora camponoti]